MSDFFVLDLLTNFKNKQKNLQECLIFQKKITRTSDFLCPLRV